MCQTARRRNTDTCNINIHCNGNFSILWTKRLSTCVTYSVHLKFLDKPQVGVFFIITKEWFRINIWPEIKGFFYFHRQMTFVNKYLNYKYVIF
jgi:hypothetical protein